MHKKFILIVCFIIVSLLSQAQSFEQYYEQAADNHPYLKAVFNEYYAILEQKKQTNKLPPPELAFGAFILPVETRLGAQRAKVGLKQMFPPIGQLKAKTLLVDKLAKIKLQEAEIKRNQLYFNLQNDWYQLLKIEELIKVIEQEEKRLDVFEQLALQKIELAKASVANVYRITLKRNELAHEKSLLENQKPALILDFKTIVNAEDSLELNLPDSIPIRVLTYAKDSLLSWINNQNPDLQLLSLKEEALTQKKAVRVTQNKASFGIGLDYVWVTKRTDADPVFNGRDILMPMATIRVPIYKAQNKARLKEVDFELLALEEKKENLQDILSVKLEQALSNYREAQIELEYYETQIRFTKKTLDALIANFSVDAKDFEEILRMEEMLFMYERMKVLSRIKQNMAVVMIEKLFAQPL